MSNLEKSIQKIVSKADIKIGGDRPWDIQVHNPDFYRRVMAGGSLALGESYMDGWWDAESVDECITRLIRARLDKEIINAPLILALIAKEKLFNLQRKSRAYNIGKQHYDIGNNLYEAMLDSRMIYSCGYWKNAATLDEAQEAKLDLVCRKIGLQKGMSVLDIGCGWGGFAVYAAEKYGAHVTGITVSHEQIELGKKKIKGLPVELRYQDYRDATGKYDRIVSLGMFEHVGTKNYRTFMQTTHRLLKDDGILLLHTIGCNVTARTFDPWLGAYIFPNAHLPSPTQITQSIEKLFVMEDWHNFGAHYDTTLMHWLKNFDAHWDELKEEYDERFRRMWRYYLMISAATFRSRKNQLWQIVLTKKGIPKGYQSIR